jgi:hypothetical protein
VPEDNVLENEVEEETPDMEETDTEEENEVAEEDADDEFEYDDEGNIVIPDVDFDPEEDEELAEDAEEEIPEQSEENEEGEGAPEETPEEEKTEEPKTEDPPAPDPRDQEIADLKRSLKRLETQAKATLKSIGVETDDAMSGLVKVAAESEGKSEAEYNADVAKKENDEIARNMLRNQLFEAKAAADLKELHTLYPETKQYKHLKEMPPEVLKTFGAQRDAGFSVKQAYAAANPDGIRKEVATSVKKQAQHDSKAHLKSSVPKPSKSDGVSMSKAELRELKELFPNLSTAEITKLYKQTQ